MGKELTPQLIKKLEENANLMMSKGFSEADIQDMSAQFIEEFGVEKVVKKKEDTIKSGSGFSMLSGTESKSKSPEPSKPTQSQTKAINTNPTMPDFGLKLGFPIQKPTINLKTTEQEQRIIKSKESNQTPQVFEDYRTVLQKGIQGQNKIDATFQPLSKPIVEAQTKKEVQQLKEQQQATKLAKKETHQNINAVIPELAQAKNTDEAISAILKSDMKDNFDMWQQFDDNTLLSNDETTLNDFLVKKGLKNADREAYLKGQSESNPKYQYEYERNNISSLFGAVAQRAKDYEDVLKNKFGDNYLQQANAGNENILNDTEFNTFISLKEKEKSLSTKANSLINDPRFSSIKKELDKNEDKQLKSDAIAKADKWYNPTDELRYVGSKVLYAAGKAVKMLAELPSLATSIDKGYDWTDKLADWGDRFSTDLIDAIPVSTDLKAGFNNKVAKVGNYKVIIDDNGEVADVRDNNNFKVSLDEMKSVTDKYNANPKGYKVNNEYNPRSLADNGLNTVIDMGLMILGTKGAGVLGAGEKLQKLTSMGIAYQQTKRDVFNDALKKGLDPKNADLLSNIIAVAAGASSSINPLEYNIATGKGLFNFLKTDGLNAGKLALIKEGKLSVKDYAKEFVKAGIKNTIGENIEELVIEGGTQAIANNYFNSKISATDKTDGGLDDKLHIFDKQGLETFLITAGTSLLMTPIEMKSQMLGNQQEALKLAIDNPIDFKKIRQIQVEKGQLTQDEVDKEAKIYEDVSRTYNASKDEIKEELKPQLLALLTKKYNIANKINEIKDDVLSAPYKAQLNDINKGIQDITNGIIPNESLVENTVTTTSVDDNNQEQEQEQDTDNNTNQSTIIGQAAGKGGVSILTKEKIRIANKISKGEDLTPEESDFYKAVKEDIDKITAGSITPTQQTTTSKLDNDVRLIEITPAAEMDNTQLNETFETQIANPATSTQDDLEPLLNKFKKRNEQVQVTPTESIEQGREQNDGTGISKTQQNNQGVQQKLGLGQDNNQEVPTEKGEEGVNNADVESTAKALDGSSLKGIVFADKNGVEKIVVQDNKGGGFLIKNNDGKPQNPTMGNHKDISEAYHKAKADGSNPELVEAVEKLLNDNTTPNKVNQPVSEVAKLKEKEQKNSQNNTNLVEDKAENEYINTKLTEQDNVEQEPSIKAIESQAESNDETELNEVVKKSDELINEAVGISRIPLSQLHTDESRFQAREKLNEQVVNDIANNFSDADQDPIHVWTDPKDGKTYVLSGHHRYYGAKKAGRTDVKIIDRTKDFTEKEAIKFATEDANANRSMETPLERANTLRKKREKGDSKEEIKTFLDKEGKNKNYVDNLSYLNPNGKTIKTLNSVEDSGNKVTQKETEKIADWIGEARRTINGLTDAHEKEMHDFLMDKNASKRITTKADFLQKVRSVVNPLLSEEPLNLNRFKNKTQGEESYDEEVADKKSEIADRQKKIDTINDRFSNPANPDYIKTSSPDYAQARKIADDKISKLDAERKALQKQLEDIYRNKGKYVSAPSTGSLFQSTDKTFTTIPQKAFDKLVDKLKKAFPSVKVELFAKNDFENAKKELQDKGIEITDTKTKDGTIYGFKTPDGKVFINTDNLNANTPIHEFGHIWQSVFPQGFARGIELLKLSPQGQALIKEIQKNPAYKGKSLADIQAEALVTAIGNKGETIFNSNPTLFAKFKEWLSDFFKAIGDKLGIKNLSADDKFNKFTKDVVGELLGGKVLDKNIGTKTSNQKTINFQGKDIKVKEINGGAEVVNGFYSPLEKIIGETKFDKLPAKQWIDKFGKGDEAKWTGLTEWLSQQQGSVSKADIQQFLKDNRIEIVEIVKGEDMPNYKLGAEPPSELGANRIDLLGDLGKAGNLDNPRFREYLNKKYGKNGNKIYDWLAENATVEGNYSKDTKYSQYQLEGEKENYKEVLVTMPSRNDNLSEKEYEEFRRIDDKVYYDRTPEEQRKYVEYQNRFTKSRETNKDFKSSHFDEPNILVHLRMNTRTDAEGNKVLFLEEVQSDWGQKGKKEGFNIPAKKNEFRKEKQSDGSWVVKDANNTAWWHGSTEERADAVINEYNTRETRIPKEVGAIPNAPFVTDTNAWTKLGLKVALKEAVKQGADKIAWSTGTQQFDRWGSEEIHWNTVMKPKGFEIVVKDDAKRPIVRGSRIKSLSSNDGSQNQQAEVKRLAEKWNLKPEDLEVIPSKGQWTLAINEQTDAQAFQGNEEVLRSNKLEESDISVGTKAELRDAIKRNLSRERNDAEIDKLTDRIWNRMQTEDSGTSLPRKEGMEEFYGNPKDMERAKNFTIKKEGELFAVKDEKGKTIRTFKQENEANKFKENYGLGIVGNVAKSLFKQEPKTVEIYQSDKLASGWSVTVKDKQGNISTQMFDSKSKGLAWLSKQNGLDILSEDAEGKNYSTQHSIDITPEMKAEVETGMPLFQYRKSELQSAVDAMRNDGMTDEEIRKFLDAIEQPKEEIDSVLEKQPKEKEKRLLNKAFKGTTDEELKSFIEDYGLTYDTESQIIAEEEANDIINIVGLEKAFQAVQNGYISGAQAAVVYAKMVDHIEAQLQKGNLSDEELVKLKELQAYTIDIFDNAARDAGRFIAMLKRVYHKSLFTYDAMVKSAENAKGTPLTEEERLIIKEQAEKIAELDKTIKELEEKLEQERAENAVQKIKADINKPKPTSVSFKAKAKAFADKIRGLKTKGLVLKDADGNPINITQNSIVSYNEIIEMVAKTIEKTGDVLEGITVALSEVKKQDWYQKLTQRDKDAVDKQIKQDILDLDEDVSDDKFKIPHSLIREIVKNGTEDIDGIVKKVLEVYHDIYPDLDERKVRDIITKYGEQKKDTRDDIDKKISEAKRIGRHLSGKEDLLNGKPPKRSGFKRDKPTPTERLLMQEIQQLLKNIPKSQEEIDNLWTTALEKAKTRITNRIEELQLAIDKKERINKTKNVQNYNDTDLDKLKDDLKAKQKEYDDLFPKEKTELSDEQRLILSVNAKKKQLETLQSQKDSKVYERNKKDAPDRSKFPKLDKEIKDLDDKIKGIKEEIKQDDSWVKHIEKKRISLAIKANQRRIEEYRRMINEKDFVVVKNPTPISDELTKVRRERQKVADEYELAKYKHELENRTLGQKIFDGIFEGLQLSKQFVATADLSAPLRQGGTVIFSNPIIWAKAFVDMHGQAFSHQTYKDTIDAIKNSKYYDLAQDSKLAITDADSIDERKREEQFVSKLMDSNFMKKAPILAQYRQINKGSERAYSGFLNNIRFNLFEKGAKELEQAGYTFSDNPKMYKALATTINNLTGRGWSPSGNEGKLLNFVLFSPKMLTSRVLLMYDLLRTDIPLNSPSRKMAAKSLLGTAAWISIFNILGTMAVNALDDDDDKEEKVNINPIATDFIKVRSKQTTFDPTAGYAPLVRTLARIITEKSINASGKEKDLSKGYGQTRFSPFWDFMENKLSPIASYGLSLLTHKNPQNKFEDASKAEWNDYITPLFVPLQAMLLVENFNDKDSFGKDFIETVLSLYGIGVAQYDNTSKGNKNANSQTGNRRTERDNTARTTNRRTER